MPVAIVHSARVRKEKAVQLTIADLIFDDGSCKPAIKARLMGCLISSDGHGPTYCGKTPDQYFLIYKLMRTAADCRMARSSS